jgi:tetratricopeptide (TPR) repeat protein
MSVWESREEQQLRNDTWRKTLTNPDTQQGFRDICDAVAKGRLTLSQVGGFSKEELDSAYAGACKLLLTGKEDDALQVAGFLILLDPYDARLYCLAGACFQKRRQYEMAVHYYTVALGLKEDAATLLSKGEALLYLARRDEARETLERGLALAALAGPGMEAAKERAQRLLTSYLSGGDR